MKLLSFLLIVLLFVSCQKKQGTSDKMVYTVNGLTDVTVPQYKDTTVYIAYNVLFVSGVQDVATITLKDLPAGVTLATPSVSGTPTFGPQFVLDMRMMNAGTYPITVEATSASAQKKTLHFNVIVSPQQASQYSISASDVSTTFTNAPQTLNMHVYVNYVSGPVELVTLSVDGLPAGVTATTSADTGRGSFNTTYILNVPASLSAGTYPINIHSSSAIAGTQTKTVNLVMQRSCALDISGSNYTTTTTCTSYAGPETGVHTGGIITASMPYSDNNVLLYTPFSSIYLAILDCASGLMVNPGVGNPPYGSFVHYPAHDTATFTYSPSGISGTCTTIYMR